MDLDTPPRPIPSPTIFSPSVCQVSPDLFGFNSIMETDPIPSTSTLPPFNPIEFDAKESFGLQEEVEPTPPLVVAETRRRKSKKESKRSPEVEEVEEVEDSDSVQAFGGMVAKRMGKGAFSFQVHHHHNQNSHSPNFDPQGIPLDKKKWLDKSTPYTLLG